MDEENEVSADRETEAIPLAWPDFVVPVVRAFGGLAEGVMLGLRGLNNALVEHSLFVAQQKAVRARNAADAAAMKVTESQLGHLTVADFEERDG